MEKVYHLGMSYWSLSDISDCDLCNLTLCFNVIRESSVISTNPDKVSVEAIAMHVQVSVWKGRIDNREQLLAYHGIKGSNYPVDLIYRWIEQWDGHCRFSGIVDDTATGRPG